MMANVLSNGLPYELMQPVMNSVHPICNQLDYVGKLDLIAVAVIGVIVIVGAIFALMCRYE